MRTGMIALALALSFLLTSSVALADHSALTARGQGKAQAQTHSQGKGLGLEKKLQKKDKAQVQNQKDDQDDGDEGNDQNGRRGAAGVVANRASGGFDLNTKNGTIKVTVDESTRYKIKGDKNPSYDDVKAGQRVNVNGTRDEAGNLKAKSVHVVPAAGLSKNAKKNAVGKVTAFTAANEGTAGSITVEDKRSGLDRTFKVNSDTKITLPSDHTAVAPNDMVTVIGTKADASVARRIAVHGPDQDEDENEDQD